MANVEQIGNLNRSVAHNLAAKYGLSRFAIFGSFARGEEKPESDLDILVEWQGRPGLDRFMGFIEEVEQVTGRRVDIASEKSLHWHVKDQILADAKDLL